MGRDRLISIDRRTMDRAYALHSGFRVGAAVPGSDSSVHAGCNVENESKDESRS